MHGGARGWRAASCTSCSRPSVNASGWDSALEPCDDGSFAIRLGLRQVDGFRQDWAVALVAERARPFASVEELAARAGLPPRALRLLADADAYRSLNLARRDAVWAVRRTPPKQLALFAAADAAPASPEWCWSASGPARATRSS